MAVLLIWLVTLAISRQAEANGKTCIWRAGGSATFGSNSWKNCEGLFGNNPPSGTDVAQFDGTSSSNCTISAALGIPQISINAGYTGTVTVSAALTVTGNLTISAGTLGGSSPISVGGNWSNASAGTFTGTGTITLTGSGTLTSGGATFAALTVNASGTYTQQDALSTTKLTVSGGTLTAGTNSVGVVREG